jgi:methylase of polypeptide subunit release factors
MFFTDRAIVDAMLRWVGRQEPREVIDCGAGSGRFALSAVRLPTVESITAVELDPLACLVIRGNAAVRAAANVRVLNADFTRLKLERTSGRRAFVGNPPYVRHHELAAAQKLHGRKLATRLGVPFSGLSGLHTYFLLSAAALSAHGDVLCFITSAEWLDVNYGRGMRDLLLDGLRAEQLHLLDAEAEAFADVASTAVIVCARSGGDAKKTLFKVASSVRTLLQLEVGGHEVAHTDLEKVQGWGRIARQEYNDVTSTAIVNLGSIARVHRGIVTGANDFFVLTKDRATELGITKWCRPVISSADEVFECGGVITDSERRKVLLCPPEDLQLDQHPKLSAYLRIGEILRIPERYVTSHRKKWWSPQTHEAPPIVATYMARQAPAFALNPGGLLLLNVVHGLHPKVALRPDQLHELVESLNASRNAYRGSGRTYHGGLEKFEPREMERLVISLAPDRVGLLCDGT